MKTIKKILLALALAATFFACSLPSQTNETTPPGEGPDIVSTSVAATQTAVTGESPDPEATDAPASLLPHSVFFLSEDGGDGTQVWTVNAFGDPAVKITAEAAGVDAFAVSPADGRIAYLTNNQLIVLNADGVGRSVLVDASSLIAETERYFYTQQLGGLAWSPDGSRLAYGQNGLHIYDFTTAKDTHVIANEIDDAEPSLIFPVALYSPLEWSPDGSQLLVNISFYEAGTLGVYATATGSVTRLGEGILCCHPTWSPDSASIVVASPYLGIVESGMWRVDTATDAKTELIPTTSADETLNFAGWPVVLPDGSLRYFYTNTPDFPSGNVPLIMVSSAADGETDRTILRPETWDNFEAIWAEDGSLAVTIQPDPAAEASWPRLGPIVVIPASEDAVIPLGADGYQLQWGP